MNQHHFACRFCGAPLKETFVDLGMSPLANSYIKPENLNREEPFYPLHTLVCSKCYLVQLPVFQSSSEIFSDYAYFSSYSDFFLDHARQYVTMMMDRFAYNQQHLVVEIASNDGYLLKNFIEVSVPVLGIEPAKNVAKAAIEIGIPTITEFFGEHLAHDLARQGKMADLLIGNNVLAHVPDLNDFVRGMRLVLKPNGIITMEFPHLMQLISCNQFDTIYHEHFSYFSFLSVYHIFAEHGLTIFDVEEISTHGGSLRIFACHAGDTTKTIHPRVKELTSREKKAGYDTLDTYRSFTHKVLETKRNILSFLIDLKQQGKSIAAYGAPAKANTLLNYCGIRRDFIDYTVDRSPHKQGHFLPGTHIPIYAPDVIKETKPDYLIILAWNLKDEIMGQMAHIRDWGGQFVTLIPGIETYA